MKIKTYVYKGTSETEVIARAKAELGEDAVILTMKRTNHKGVMKLFKKPEVELTAIKKTKKEEPKVQKVVEDRESKEKIKQQEKVIRNLEDKLGSLEGLLNKVMDKLSDQPAVVHNTDRKYKSTILQLFHDNLEKNEVEAVVIENLLKGLDEEAVNSGKGINQLVSIVYDRIVKLLGNPKPIEIDSDDDETKYVLFIGPTGVGKTTTIAKVTAHFMLNERKKVGLMTADTYRIAAVDQLKKYAEILGLGVEVLYSIDEFEEKKNTFSNCDAVLIDTAGRSHKNEQRFSELSNLLNEISKKEVYLVLSLSTKYKDILDIIESYSEVADYKIIFTKQDETTTLGTIINVKHMTQKPLSYITFGQNVPDDIEVLQPEKIAKLLLGSEINV